jgi:hypothetical protein
MSLQANNFRSGKDDKGIKDVAFSQDRLLEYFLPQVGGHRNLRRTSNMSKVR